MRFEFQFLLKHFYLFSCVTLKWTFVKCIIYIFVETTIFKTKRWERNLPLSFLISWRILIKTSLAGPVVWRKRIRNFQNKFQSLIFLWKVSQFCIGNKTVATSRLENWNQQMTKACLQIMEILFFAPKLKVTKL